MYGFCGFADSPSPWLMIELICGDGQCLTDILERGHVLRDPSLALLAVTGSAREIDEKMPAHRHMRVARIAATVAATTASSKRNSRNAGCDNKGERQGNPAHPASIRLPRRAFNLGWSIGPAFDPAWLRTRRSLRPASGNPPQRERLRTRCGGRPPIPLWLRQLQTRVGSP